MEYSWTAHTLISRLTFRNAVWLFPAVFTLHVFEEWPRFAQARCSFVTLSQHLKLLCTSSA